MTRERLNELWPVMEHFKNGGEVESLENDRVWRLNENPYWHDAWDYRIAQPNPMTFMEAVEAMKQGKKVRRRSWENKKAILHSSDGWVEWVGLDGNPFLQIKDIEATDWEVVG